MTYKHLTTRELTLIAEFYRQDTRAYQVAKSLSVVLKQFIEFIVTWIRVRQLRSI